jgi:hypothetical protein
MALKRLDNLGIVVDDLAMTIDFLRELGPTEPASSALRPFGPTDPI